MNKFLNNIKRNKIKANKKPAFGADFLRIARNAIILTCYPIFIIANQITLSIVRGIFSGRGRHGICTRRFLDSKPESALRAAHGEFIITPNTIIN